MLLIHVTVELELPHLRSFSRLRKRLESFSLLITVLPDIALGSHVKPTTKNYFSCGKGSHPGSCPSPGTPWKASPAHPQTDHEWLFLHPIPSLLGLFPTLLLLGHAEHLTLSSPGPYLMDSSEQSTWVFICPRTPSMSLPMYCSI